MSTFEVLVRKIDKVIDHPNADRLSILSILGYEAISAKNEDGTHKFAVGDNIVYVPEAAIVPEHLLKQFGFWDTTKERGMLAGRNYDRVKAVRLRGVLSQGLVWGLDRDGDTLVAHNGDTTAEVAFGDNVADFFGITKYEPPVPVGMSGEVAAVYNFAIGFDIENAQNFPGFLDNDTVEATEKLHGTCFRVAYRPDFSHEELFGTTGGVAVSSKGLGAKGLVFKNNEKNANNLYVRTAVELNLIERVEALGKELGYSIDLFGEIFGQGVQDLHYGATTPTFRAFDIAINGVFEGAATKAIYFDRLGVERVPVLYTGPWDTDVLVGLRDGKTTVGGDNIREGIVVTATGGQEKREFNNNRLRPVLKMVSPDYLTRKGDVTEYQ